MYHPSYFKTLECGEKDNLDKKGNCARAPFCAFFHTEKEREQEVSDINYNKPLKRKNIKAHLQFDFMTPPLESFTA